MGKKVSVIFEDDFVETVSLPFSRDGFTKLFHTDCVYLVLGATYNFLGKFDCETFARIFAKKMSFEFAEQIFVFGLELDNWDLLMTYKNGELTE